MALHIEKFGDVTRLRMTSVGSRAVGLDVSTYVIDGVMIDTGFHRARRRLLAAVRTMDVRAAIVTHWHEDHAGNVSLLASQGLPLLVRGDTEGTLRTRPHVQLYRRVVWGYAHALTRPLIPFDGGRFECIHTPGHSADHQVVWDPTTGTLFSGDLWLGVRSRVLHASEDPYAIVNSLRIVEALQPTRMFDAHRGMVENPAAAIRAKIDWMSQTLGTVEKQIAEGRSDRQIVNDVLGGEEMSAVVSRGDYSRRNLVKAVRRRLQLSSRASQRSGDVVIPSEPA
jgi:ribonuclease/clavin/mitogillin